VERRVERRETREIERKSVSERQRGKGKARREACS